jgi:hypothetical protein
MFSSQAQSPVIIKSLRSYVERNPTFFRAMFWSERVIKLQEKKTQRKESHQTRKEGRKMKEERNRVRKEEIMLKNKESLF